MWQNSSNQNISRNHAVLEPISNEDFVHTIFHQEPISDNNCFKGVLKFCSTIEKLVNISAAENINKILWDKEPG